MDARRTRAFGRVALKDGMAWHGIALDLAGPTAEDHCSSRYGTEIGGRLRADVKQGKPSMPAGTHGTAAMWPCLAFVLLGGIGQKLCEKETRTGKGEREKKRTEEKKKRAKKNKVYWRAEWTPARVRRRPSPVVLHKRLQGLEG